MPLSARTATRLARHAALGGLALAACAATLAANIDVRVSGLNAPLGRVGCSLFTAEAGFPMDTSGARVQWHDADAQGVSCRFTGLPAGRYAVSVMHDRNGNQQVDTNFVGLPTEPWGVSNNLRPRLRAPRFDEAAFLLGSEPRPLVLDIRVAQ